MSYNNKHSLVVIFGRPNVGKSALFNCLTEKKHALVSNVPGTTRDSNIGMVNWRGKKFNLVDTGGIIDLSRLYKKPGKAEDIDAKVEEQARGYLKRADLVLFLVDNKSGLLPADKILSMFLKKSVDNNKVLLIANKADSLKDHIKSAEFYKLAFGKPITVSAANGSGTGDLLDILMEKLFKKEDPDNNLAAAEAEVEPIEVSIIGKPNVGKSSLINSLLGYPRVIISQEPHTTREPQDTMIIYKNQPLVLIDTAGISKKATKGSGLEKYGVEKSLAALARSDIAIFVLDISQEITGQDLRLADEILKLKKSLIIVANKWDKIPDKDYKKYTNYIYGKMPYADFAPIQFVSALTRTKVHKVFDLILEIINQRKIEISQTQINKFLSRIVRIHRPARGKGVKHPRIYEFKQTDVSPPRFELRIGVKEDLHFSYLRFIENRLRENFGFLGTPITIKIVKGRNYQIPNLK